MPAVRSFVGLRYGAAAGELDRLLCPPTGEITPGGRAAYAERSPYNAVHLVLPEGKADDRSKFVRYARAGALTQEWGRDGVLERDEAPGFYRLQAGGTAGLYVLARIEDLPTDAAPDERTLRLLEATRTHFEPVVASVEGLGPDVLRRLQRAAGHRQAEADLDGLPVALDRITEDEHHAVVTEVLANATFTVLEGGDRVAAARAHRDRRPGTPEAEAWIPVALLADPRSEPRHRVYDRLSEADIARIEGLGPGEAVHSSRLRALPSTDERALGLALEGGRGVVLRGVGVEDLDRALGTRAREGVSYTRDVNETIRACNEGAVGVILTDRFVSGDSLLQDPPPVGLVYWNGGDFV